MDEASHILHELHERISHACIRAGREPSEVTLIGAAKTVPAERLRPFLKAGLTDVGENYVQEGIAKIAQVGDHATPQATRWHLIGALQSNKAREAVRWFNVIHSVDRLSLAVAIDKAARAQNKVQEVLLQVNMGAEASKAGCAPEELTKLAQECATLSNLRVRGLMCLPPYHDDPEQMRPYFRQLREARDALWQESGVFFSSVVNTDNSSHINNQDRHVGHLSMGMSNDFEVAIEEGATFVRIGTSLFGARTRSTMHQKV